MSVLIIGGTGTLGKELTRQLYGKTHITIFSRDEHKQAAMRREFPKCTYRLGDIKEEFSLPAPFFDKVYLTAALKHVDVLEENPEQCWRTNIEGVENVLNIYAEDVKFCTTDKAVKPINVYGASKMVAEKLAHTYGAQIYRWGNVIGSQGSAIPFFIQRIKENKFIPLTDERMTRFWIRIEDAARFMIEEEGSGILIPPMKAAKVTEICHAIGELIGNEVNFEHVGLRPGEKIHEELDDGTTSETCEHYTREELKDLLREFV